MGRDAPCERLEVAAAQAGTLSLLLHGINNECGPPRAHRAGDDGHHVHFVWRLMPFRYLLMQRLYSNDLLSGPNEELIFPVRGEIISWPRQSNSPGVAHPTTDKPFAAEPQCWIANIRGNM